MSSTKLSCRVYLRSISLSYFCPNILALVLLSVCLPLSLTAVYLRATPGFAGTLHLHIYVSRHKLIIFSCRETRWSTCYTTQTENHRRTPAHRCCRWLPTSLYWNRSNFWFHHLWAVDLRVSCFGTARGRHLMTSVNPSLSLVASIDDRRLYPVLSTFIEWQAVGPWSWSNVVV